MCVWGGMLTREHEANLEMLGTVEGLVWAESGGATVLVLSEPDAGGTYLFITFVNSEACRCLCFPGQPGL